ncbi:VapC toxin protein [hydrothermal vent metagenome]|uniref:VapC toxin protein n=1 Tax=hydrothermal vent metagenome TaxID=652676 RepID=A0A3B1E3R4_9ZZZZ
MKYLLDTCVISELVKVKPNKRVVEWIAQCYDEDLYLSALTIGEIQKGIDRLPKSKKKSRLYLWIKEDLSERFKGRILDVNESVARAWGSLLAKEEEKGRKVPVIDSLIAATAVIFSLTVVTRNTKDIELDDVSVFNPWGK